MENLNIIGKLVNRLRMINYMYITVIWDIKLEPEELWGRNNIEPLFSSGGYMEFQFLPL